MKFSLSLKYNSVPEWQDKYLNYSQLKKTIYDLQAETLKEENPVSTEEGSMSSKLAPLKKLWRKPDATNQTTIELTDMESGSSDNANTTNGAKNFFASKFGNKNSNKVKDKEEIEADDPSSIFLKKLEVELAKIDEFYSAKEGELYLEYDELIGDLEVAKVHFTDPNNYFNETKSILSNKSSINEAILNASNSFNLDIEKNGAVKHREITTASSSLSRSKTTQNEFDEDEEFDEDDDHSENSALLTPSDLNMKAQNHITLKRRTTQLFVDLSQLKSYIELNRIGFNKITKKFDKTLNTKLKQELFESNLFFENSHTFNYSILTNLDAKLESLIEVYGSLTDRVDKLDECKTELRSYLREQIVWERNTVWRDMIGMETGKAKAADADALANEKLYSIEYLSWPLPIPVNLYFTKWENFRIPKLFFTPRSYKLIIIIGITAILLGVKTFNDQAEHRCMALLACVALLWATEAIPLFVTAILCPLLVVLFRVVKDDDGKVMGAADSSSYILSKMWSSTIMVLLAGFTLAAALSKYNIAKVLASYILAVAGTKPRNILISIMAVALFLSMWISNVAAPVLCYSLIQGVLRTQSTDSPFAKALILGVALASNIAGMSSPISSPQNIVALEYLSPYGVGWGQWLAVSIPVSIIAMVLVWVLLITTFKVSTAKVIKYKPIKENFTIKQWFIVFVTLGTIILWCVLTKLESTFGESGEIAVIPIVLFFGTGILSSSDINNFPWSIVILAMGSLSLGKAVSSSGLLATIANALAKKVLGFSIFVIMIIFGILILVIGTFVSHTVSAIIIIPLVQEIGDMLPDKSSSPILIFATALLASCGMGLASSGFPNVTAISMTDELGVRYLSVNNFITRGVPASFIAYLVVITVGYGIMISTL